MAGKTPSTRMTMGRAQAVKGAGRGPNPDDKMQGKMSIPGPARFAGTFSASQGPVSGGQGPHKFYIPDKPISTQKGQPAKRA